MKALTTSVFILVLTWATVNMCAMQTVTGGPNASANAKVHLKKSAKYGFKRLRGGGCKK